jgi:hypothetical protein
VKRIKNFLLATGLVACGIGAVGLSFSPSAQADAWNKKTIVTVSEPIIAGNVVLEPGTYVWKLFDSPSERHVVQIFNREENHVFTTVIAIPNYRLHPTDHTQFKFWETPDGVPKAVRAWFYPGDNFGQEFAFPKKLVAQLASARPVPIPESYVEPAPEPTPAPAPEPAPVAEPQPEPTPAPEPAPAPEPQPAPQAQSAPAPAPVQPEALPKTASNFPLIGLVGLLSLAASGVLSLAAKRS